MRGCAGKLWKGALRRAQAAMTVLLELVGVWRWLWSGTVADVADGFGCGGRLRMWRTRARGLGPVMHTLSSGVSVRISFGTCFACGVLGDCGVHGVKLTEIPWTSVILKAEYLRSRAHLAKINCVIGAVHGPTCERRMADRTSPRTFTASARACVYVCRCAIREREDRRNCAPMHGGLMHCDLQIRIRFTCESFMDYVIPLQTVQFYRPVV